MAGDTLKDLMTKPKFSFEAPEGQYNTEVPLHNGEPDRTKQTNYLLLNRAQKNIVDRAIHSTLLDGTQTNPRFSAAVLAALDGKAPDSLQIERAIEGLREQYAKELRNGGPAAESRLTHLGADAPPPDIARIGLNLIIAVGGDETCGCVMKGTPFDLKATLAQVNRSTHGSQR